MPTPTDDPEELSDRQKQLLRLIVDQIANDPLHQPPTYREALEEMNKRLPKRRDGKPPLAGTVQIIRLAEQLRRLGLLVDVSKLQPTRVRLRNLVPTGKGERLVRKWQREETQKSKGRSTD